MSVETFTVQSTSLIITVITLVVVAIGAIMIAAGFSKKLLNIFVTYSLKAHPNDNKYVYLVVGILVICLGIGIYAITSTPATIVIGPQYVSYQSGILNGGSMTVTSNQVSNAYIGLLGQGDLRMTRTFGTSAGNVNMGLFQLANGKTAHVVSCNQTSLIIELKNGQNVILGTSDTNTLAVSFSENVFQMKTP